MNAHKTTLLLSAGALGAGPTEQIVAQFKHLRHDVQTVVCCGRADDLQRRVRALVRDEGSRFHVLGFSDRMFELMQMADLFIGKPGGMTAAEALACGLPMVISSPIPRQEERNSDHLLEEGIAIKCNELTTIPFKIDRLLANPERLQQMRRNALALGRPDAAHHVVRTLRSEGNFANVRLIALSGYGQPADRKRSQEAGFNDHLIKPVALNKLLSVLSGR